jgi:hypothetical protein
VFDSPPLEGLGWGKSQEGPWGDVKKNPLEGLGWGKKKRKKQDGENKKEFIEEKQKS